MLSNDTQTDGMERSDIHVLRIDLDIQFRKLVRYTGNKFFGGLLGKGDDHDLAWIDMLLSNQVNHS